MQQFAQFQTVLYNTGLEQQIESVISITRKSEADTVVLVGIAMSGLNNKERQILQAFKHRVLDQFPGELSEIRVFGSMARGDATEESDIDVLVITKSDDWRIGDVVRRIGYDLDSEINYKLSIQVLPAQHINYLADNHFIFYRNVVQEGIPI